jgi:heat shock protein 4
MSWICEDLTDSPSVQRRAVLDAADIAGLKVLQLMNETAATALNWGLPKSLELPEDSAAPKHVLFFDMGFTSTQVRAALLYCFACFHLG